jgi:hypothetical protein
MRSTLDRIFLCAFIGAMAAIFFSAASLPAFAQGGEPQYFAIRGAKVVPVSGPPIEDATVVMARGVILAVAKDAPSRPMPGSSKARGSRFIPDWLMRLPTSAWRLRCLRPRLTVSAAGPAPAHGGSGAWTGGSSQQHTVAQRCRRGQPDGQAHRDVAKCWIYHRSFFSQSRIFSRASGSA